MARPRFRFVDPHLPVEADAEFWRDVEASERLGSPAKAEGYLRDLCHARAWDAAPVAGDAATCARRERSLLEGLRARGYRLASTEGETASSRRVAG